MSYVDSMVLVVLGVASSLKCLVLYLWWKRGQQPHSQAPPRHIEMEWNGKKLQQQTANAMGPCDVDKHQNLTFGHSGVILHTEGSP